jgi:hypothetical protein
VFGLRLLCIKIVDLNLANYFDTLTVHSILINIFRLWHLLLLYLGFDFWLDLLLLGLFFFLNNFGCDLIFFVQVND